MAEKAHISVGKRNFAHVLNGPCGDPDCELHNPGVIEDEDSMWTALAWFYVGAEAFRQDAQSAVMDVAWAEFREFHNLSLTT